MWSCGNTADGGGLRSYKRAEPASRLLSQLVVVCFITPRSELCAPPSPAIQAAWRPSPPPRPAPFCTGALPPPCGSRAGSAGRHRAHRSPRPSGSPARGPGRCGCTPPTRRRRRRRPPTPAPPASWWTMCCPRLRAQVGGGGALLPRSVGGCAHLPCPAAAAPSLLTTGAARCRRQRRRHDARGAQGGGRLPAAAGRHRGGQGEEGRRPQGLPCGVRARLRQRGGSPGTAAPTRPPAPPPPACPACRPSGRCRTPWCLGTTTWPT